MRSVVSMGFRARSVQIAAACFAGCVAQQASLAQSCGMWAGYLSLERVGCLPLDFLVSGQGQDIGCGGPGHWPVIIIKNLTTESETYVEVGFCGGCNCVYKLDFRPQEPDYSPGDWVEFIRGNRSLGQLPAPCDETGLLLQIPDNRSADCTQDGAVDLWDFLCFVNAFQAEDAYADWDKDDAFTLFDFLAFVSAFSLGC